MYTCTKLIVVETVLDNVSEEQVTYVNQATLEIVAGDVEVVLFVQITLLCMASHKTSKQKKTVTHKSRNKMLSGIAELFFGQGG